MNLLRSDKVSLLFITRKYPPMVGGMEKVSFALAQEFAKNTNLHLVSWGYTQKLLPIFLTIALIKSLWIIPNKRIKNVHLGDALLSPLGLLLKKIYGVRVSVTVHGLDITYKLPIYQLVIPFCLRRLDKIICISNTTRNECLKRGIPSSKSIVIAWGIHPESFLLPANKSALEKITRRKLSDKKIIVTVGRLVKRKGVYWFIENVLPELNKNVIYLVIGDGVERERIQSLIEEKGYKEKVILLGKVSDLDLKVVYNTADIFVMPNIPVDNDIEGFGIVALEASSTGLMVIASDLEGVKDAVVNEKNGYLVETLNSTGFIRKLTKILNPPICLKIKLKTGFQKIILFLKLQRVT